MVKVAKIHDALRDAENGKVPRFVLVYGPDRGVCRRNIDIFANSLKSFHPELEIRFFNEDDIAKDFSSLEEAISGSSLFGGAAIAKLNIKSDGLGSKFVPLLKTYGDDGNIDGALMINGNGLQYNSKLVAAFEKAQKAWVIRTYDPTPAEFSGFIKQKAQEEGVKINNDAIAYLIEITAQDSEILINETQNLALYVGKGNEITIDAINDLSVGGREGKIEEIINSAFNGKSKTAIIKNYQSKMAGLNHIVILNSLLRRLKQLMLMRSEYDKGVTAEALVKERRFNIFWKEQDNFKKQIMNWSLPALENVYSKTVETDSLLKQTNYPTQETLEKLFMTIAQFASRKKL